MKHMIFLTAYYSLHIHRNSNGEKSHTGNVVALSNFAYKMITEEDISQLIGNYCNTPSKLFLNL